MTFAASPPPCVILAGGRSSRMGSNKALATLGGLTLLSHIVARIAPQAGAVALNATADWEDGNGLRRVPDTLPGQLGPLAGVLAALRDTAIHHPGATHVLTVPTDGPVLPPDLVARLTGASGDGQTIAIASSNGEQHPIVALWPVALADELEDWIVKDDTRRVRDFQRRYPLAEVIFPLIETAVGPFDPFLNVNTPEDLAAAEHWLEALSR
jgi:molybdopterin-guanine dinucleotide biosynthesis protein A